MLLDVFNLPILVYYVGVLVVLLVAMRLYLDFSEVSSRRRLNRKLLMLAVKQARQPINVVIELRHSVDRVTPLLEDIYSQNYPELEVVVIIRPSAGRLAMSKLDQFRRRHQVKNLKLRRVPASVLLEAAVIRQASAPIVVVLPEEARLTGGFFEAVMLEGLAAEDRPVHLSVYEMVGRSLGSGVRAHLGVWPNLLRRLHNRGVVGLCLGVIYQRRFLTRRQLSSHYRLAQSFRAAVWVTAEALDKRKVAEKKMASSFTPKQMTVASLILIGAAGLLMTAGAPRDGWLLLVAINVAYLVAFWFATAGTPYSRLDKASLVLLSPFVLIILIFKTVTSLLKPVSSFKPARFIRARQ